MGGSSTYRIVVKGELDPRWFDRLGGMRITIDRLVEKGPVTTLVGPLRDQAALEGVLNTIFDLHLPVLSVERLNEQEF